jgi:hypothetical protein
MSYIVTGTLRARISGHVERPITNAAVQLYKVPEEQLETGTVATAAAPTRQTFGIVSSETLKEREDQKLGEEMEVREDGSFVVRISEEEYNGELPFVIVARFGDPRGEDEGDGERVPVQITTVSPLANGWETPQGDHYPFEVSEGDDVYEVNEEATRLTGKQYCRILEEHEVWVVTGQITDCDTGEEQPGLTVEVFDADIYQPDPLGTDTTDANGSYVVYYARPDFEVTPSQFPSVELIGGPDLYFTVRRGGKTFINESSSAGRQSGREDVGRCTHIDHCVDAPESIPPITAAAWVAIGRYSIPDSNGLNDFDPDGYTDSNKFAFHGTLPLEGSVPVANVPIGRAGSRPPVRYRFKVKQSPQLKNGQGTVQNFNQIVGDGNNLFRETPVGALVYQQGNTRDWFKVWVESGDLNNPGGWVRIDEVIKKTYNQRKQSGLTAGPLQDYRWYSAGTLAHLRTEPLTTESDVPENAAAAGGAVPQSDRIADERIAIRFEIEERKASGWTSLPSKTGTTLNRLVVNNNPAFRKLGIPQLDGNPCKRIKTSDVDLEYTVYHPHLRGARLQIRRAGANQNWSAALNDSSTELSFADVDSTAKKYEHNNNPSFDISGEVTEECAYLVRLLSQRRLTTGRSNDNWSETLRVFTTVKP